MLLAARETWASGSGNSHMKTQKQKASGGRPPPDPDLNQKLKANTPTGSRFYALSEESTQLSDSSDTEMGR